jgi:hypothetical protein
LSWLLPTVRRLYFRPVRRLRAAGRGRARRDQRSQAAENVPQGEHDQRSGNRLGTNHFPYLADTASRPARHAMDLTCRILDAATGWFTHRCFL